MCSCLSLMSDLLPVFACVWESYGCRWNNENLSWVAARTLFYLWSKTCIRGKSNPWKKSERVLSVHFSSILQVTELPCCCCLSMLDCIWQWQLQSFRFLHQSPHAPRIHCWFLGNHVTAMEMGLESHSQISLMVPPHNQSNKVKTSALWRTSIRQRKCAWFTFMSADSTEERRRGDQGP